MNLKEKRASEKALREALEAFEACKSDEGIDWDTAVGIEGLDFSKAETDEDRVAVVNKAYDSHESLVGEINEAVEAEKAADEEANRLRSREISTLKAYDAPAIHTSKSGGKEITFEKAVSGMSYGDDPVGLPMSAFTLEKAEFDTVGGGTFERTKAALNVEARWPVQMNVTQLANQPTFFDYLTVRSTDQNSWPVRGAHSGSNPNIGEQTTPGEELEEAALRAVIQDNNLYAVGAFQPVTRQQRRVPGSMGWAQDSLVDALRANVDSGLVGGTGNINGLGDRTYPAARKEPVAVFNADTNPYGVVDGLINASVKSAKARGGRAPDFCVIDWDRVGRLQKEMREYRINPENRLMRIQNMVIIPSNHTAAGKGYVGSSIDISAVLHTAGFQMEIGLTGTDFTKLQETLRVFVEMQGIFDREESLVELTFA